MSVGFCNGKVIERPAPAAVRGWAVYTWVLAGLLGCVVSVHQCLYVFPAQEAYRQEQERYRLELEVGRRELTAERQKAQDHARTLELLRRRELARQGVALAEGR